MSKKIFTKKKDRNNVPFVIESDGNGEKTFDIYSRMLNDRIVFINSEINEEVAGSVCAQLLFLESSDSEKDISLYINSPGGYITHGLAIYDTMKFIKSDVRTFCLGSCCSMAAVLLTAGKKGKRFSLPNSRIMIHQPTSGCFGTITEMDIELEEGKRLKKLLNEILAENTGQDLDTIKKDIEKNYYMTSEEAKKYGIIDKVLKSKND